MGIKVALEVGKQYLKIVTAQSQGIQLKLQDCIVEPINSLTDEQISQKIALAFQKEKIKTRFVTVCLSRDCVTIRNLHLPSHNPQEINQMLDLHIARVVPYKKDEIVYAYQSLGADEMGYTRMILAIAHKDILKRQEKILERAGLFIDKVSLSSYGIWQWAIKTSSQEIKADELYVQLDFDTTFTDFIIFSHQNLYLTRGVTIGAKALDETRAAGLTKLLSEVKQSLIIFYKEEINKKIVKVFISGAAIPPDFYKIIETEFGVPVKVVSSPFSQEAGRKSAVVPRDASITGLSELVLAESKHLISFELPEMQIRKSVRERAKDLIVLGSLVVYVFIVILAIFIGKVYNRQAYLNKINKAFSSIGQETEQLLIQSRKVDFIKNYLNQRRIPVVVMYQLQTMMTNEIALSFITIDDQGLVTMRGQAVQLSDVFKFINSVEKSKYFSEVETKYTRKKKLKDREVTDFEIAFKLST